MISHSPQRLFRAVATICPDLEKQVLRDSIILNERRLWWELSVCILSSQVPYDLAIVAADTIDSESILFKGHFLFDDIMQRLIELLSKPLLVDGKLRSYRFPVIRAQQLAGAHAVITSEKCSLQSLVGRFQDATEARTWFVKHIPGIGPKQASMFLRNIGVSYDLAILDRHVLNYMTKLGIYSDAKTSISNLTQYRNYEAVLREHAEELKCPVGILDWAIWIVMRVANQSMEPLTI